jgi:ferritin-like metal-binding protein YciE
MGWFSSDIDTFDELFVHTLQDIYYAEHQILKTLPDMAEKATDAELKRGFRSHLKQTKGHIKRLDRVFKMIKSLPQGTKCPAINAALIAAAQAVEHYEMTRYGTLVAWAKALGRNDVAKLLNMNLNEEKATDKKLGGIAKRKINRKAAARRLPRPDRGERAENALLEAAAGIPAI